MTDVETELKDAAWRAADDHFTRRVLAALPPHVAPAHPVIRRSLAAASRLGVVLALIAFAQHWYLSGTGDGKNVIWIAIFVGLVLAATARLCGPWTLRPVLPLLRRWR